jgi:SAM-dependent methyltransferase
MDPHERDAWFAANTVLLETAYLAGVEPWQQSGFGLHRPRTYARWEAVRRPVADAMDGDGTFLDVGCANGFLLECVLRWTGERGLRIEPFGLDVSERLAALARTRLPAHAGRVYVGNAWDWAPPRRFDYVRTELVYVPQPLQGAYVERLLADYLAPGGRLLAAQYRGSATSADEPPIDRFLEDRGHPVVDVKRGFWEGTEYTRIAVVPRRGD